MQNHVKYLGNIVILFLWNKHRKREKGREWLMLDFSVTFSDVACQETSHHTGG